MTTYTVFSRNPYKRVNNGFTVAYVPNSRARRYTLAKGLTIDEARKYCERGPANQRHDAGKEYRGHAFYEFIRE